MPEEETQLIPENVLNYTDKFLETKPIHPEIEKILTEKKNILDSLKTAHKQSMLTFNHCSKLIDENLKDNMDLYRNLIVISTHLPNSRRAEKNHMTLKQQEIGILVDTIIKIVEASNNIKEKIITKTEYVEKPSKKPVKKKEQNMDEQGKLGFENKIKELLVVMRDTKNKLEYETTRNKIESMIETKEQKNVTDDISRELLGKKLKEAQYAGHWKKKKK